MNKKSRNVQNSKNQNKETMSSDLWKKRCLKAHLPVHLNEDEIGNIKIPWELFHCTSAAILQIKKGLVPTSSNQEFDRVSDLDLSLYPEFSDQSIRQILTIFPNLTSLKLDGATRAGPECIEGLKALPKLKSLSMVNCPLLVSNLIGPAIAQLSLTHLSLSHCALDKEVWRSISKQPLTELKLLQNEWKLDEIPPCQLLDLQTLIIDDERGSNAKALTQFVGQLKKLEIFQLRYSRFAGANVLKSLAPSVKQIDLSWSEILKSEDLSDLHKRFPQLNSIKLARCQFLTDELFDHLAPISQLQELDVSHCKLLTSTGLNNFIHSKRLKKLSCIGCSVDEQLLQTCFSEDLMSLELPAHFHASWFREKKLSKLQKLSINGNSSLDKEGLDHLLPLLKDSNVSNLDIGGCCLSENAIAKLTQNKQLRELHLGGRVGTLIEVSQMSLLQLKNLPALQFLHLALIQNIDAHFLKNLLNNCAKLKRLEIGPIPHLSLNDLKNLREDFPFVKIDHYGYQGLPDFLKSLFFPCKTSTGQSAHSDK